MTAAIDVIERELALLTVDLAGFTRAAATSRALDLAAFLDPDRADAVPVDLATRPGTDAAKETRSRCGAALHAHGPVLVRVAMKLSLLGSLVLMVAAAASTGCGPGLSHRAKAPTDDVFLRMDAELANAIGTTTLTGAELPSSRMSVAEGTVAPEAEAEAPVAVVQTWATPASVEPPLASLYDPAATRD